MTEADLQKILNRNKDIGIHGQKKPRYQGQAHKQLQANQSKYRNVKVEVDGIKFDSKKEAARYHELMLMLAAGQISDLKLHETFVLQRAFTTTSGERIQAITYTPDFTYVKHTKSETTGLNWNQAIAEDVKASAKFQDPVYKMKKKMFIRDYPYHAHIETY